MDQSELVMPWIVAIASIIICIGLPLSAWILFRYFAHRERVEMIRHGMLPPMQLVESSASPVAKLAVRRGISLFLIGLVLLIALSYIGYATGHSVLGPWLLGGLVPMLAGVAEVVTGMVGTKSVFDDSRIADWRQSRRSSGASLESQRQEDRR